MAVTLSLTFLGGVTLTAQPAAAVIGGTPAAHLRGQVQIFVNLGYECTGTLISPNWVLTARHCFDNTGGNVNNALVVAGDRTLTRGQAMSIAGIYRHPTQDAMLLNLWQNVPNAANLVVGYSREYLAPGANVSISGWGLMTRGGNTPAPVLQVCTMRVRANSVHHDQVGAGNSAYQLVATNYGTTGPDSGVTGRGDSGAGVMYNNRVHGVLITGNAVDMSYALQTHTIAGWIQQKSRVQPS
ncbi:S1 family peptidase [Micromonospora sp. DT229]|uniref:S1 family peptidase n=1 Tax=Micromonospora sp. DT229 TaxID=3393430 RepID=UPI003CF32CBA